MNAQCARDQAMGSARDQAAKVSLRRVDHYHGEPVADLGLANREGTQKCSIINMHLFIKIDRFYCIH